MRHKERNSYTIFIMTWHWGLCDTSGWTNVLRCEEAARAQWVEAFGENLNETIKGLGWAIGALSTNQSQGGKHSRSSITLKIINVVLELGELTVCLSRPVTFEPVHPHARLNVLEISSLREITSPTARYLHLGEDVETNVFASLWIYQQLHTDSARTHVHTSEDGGVSSRSLEVKDFFSCSLPWCRSSVTTVWLKHCCWVSLYLTFSIFFENHHS